jgi:outer membrane protein assembly factor BamB
MKRCGPIFVLAAFALTSLIGLAPRAANAQGYDWPCWRGPDGNGQSLETDWDPRAIASARIAWVADVGIGYSNVAIKGGKLYVTGVSELERQFALSCLDAASGKQIWKHLFPKPSQAQSTPTIDQNQLFYLDADGTLHCFDAVTGKKRWQKNLVTDFDAVKPYYGFAGPPLVVGDVVVITANTAGMALKRDTGALAWTSEKPPKDHQGVGELSTGTMYASPVLYREGGRQLAIVSGWKGISAVDIRTGKPAWTFDWQAPNKDFITDPVVFGDKICVVQAIDQLINPAGFLLQVAGDAPLLLWKSPRLWENGAPGVILEGYLYTLFGTGFSQSGKGPTAVRCFDLETGNLMWDEQFGGPVRAKKHFSLTAAGGTLIILDDLGTLYTTEASPKGYREIARCDVLTGRDTFARLFWTPPVLCNARIYCRNFTGELVCIDVRK